MRKEVLSIHRQTSATSHEDDLQEWSSNAQYIYNILTGLTTNDSLPPHFWILSNCPASYLAACFIAALRSTYYWPRCFSVVLCISTHTSYKTRHRIIISSFFTIHFLILTNNKYIIFVIISKIWFSFFPNSPWWSVHMRTCLYWSYMVIVHNRVYIHTVQHWNHTMPTDGKCGHFDW